MTKYTIFKTDWGYFGLAGTENGILRSCLPQPNPAAAEKQLLASIGEARFDEDFFRDLQNRITSYFKGCYVTFGPEIPLLFDGLSPFAAAVLRACRQVTFGKTTSYGQLAQRVGVPGAARAVGTALSRNPIPLIIPCHRIIRSNGKIGGFSAAGGVSLKKKLLELERRAGQP